MWRTTVARWCAPATSSTSCVAVTAAGVLGGQASIAGGKVTVPSNCWKVVVVLPNGSNDVGRVTSTTCVIAINTPNNNLNTAWGGYRTTVDAY
jgi:endonuclease G